MTDQDDLLTRQEGASLTLLLNRPEKLNALSEDLCRRLERALKDAGDDERVRVIVIRGAGRAFSAGGDVKQMAHDIGTARPDAFFGRPLAAIHAAAMAVRQVEKPVIAVLHGAVAGAGLNLALCCDYRIAVEGVQLIQAFTNIGLVPDTGGTYILPRLVGIGRATELLFEGRAVGAKEAMDIGLINVVTTPDRVEETLGALVARLAARPTHALGLTKRLLNQGAENTFARQLEAEQLCQQELGANSPDYVEGVRALLERRPARFTGR